MDKMNQMMIHNTANIRYGSVRTIVWTAATRKWKIRLRDATQAFGQTNRTSRYIALKPAPEFGLDQDIFIDLLK